MKKSRRIEFDPKNILKNILLLIVSLLVILLILEAFVATFFPQEIVPNIIRTDNYTKYSLKENYVGVQSSPEFRVVLETNSHGLRDREFNYSKPDGTYRILALGDSFTFGDGVELEETFLKVLESDLNSGSHGEYENYEVINGGVYGWGTVQEYVFLEKKGLEYDPDMVIVGFFNDFGDNVNTCNLIEFGSGGIKIKGAEKDSLMKLRDFTNSIPLYDFLSQNSHLLHLVKKFVMISMARDTGTEKPSVEDAEQCDGWDITTKTLLGFRGLLDSRGKGLLVVLIPSISQVGNESLTFEMDWAPEGETLAGFLNKNGIHFVDMLPVFRKIAEEGGEMYFPIDGHCNVEGNEAMGKEIYKYVLDNKLVI